MVAIDVSFGPQSPVDVHAAEGIRCDAGDALLVLLLDDAFSCRRLHNAMFFLRW